MAMDLPPEREAGAPGPASRIDAQILAIWCALRVNPSLDARWAMQVIDRLLDERSRPGPAPAPAPPPASAALAAPGLMPGTPGQQAILASVIKALLAGEPG